MKNINTFTCKNKNSQEYIRHEYPKNGSSHPFDISSELQYFIFAEGYTYLTKLEQCKKTKDILKTIPKAYRPYTICERCFMIHKGNIVWKNKELNDDEEYLVVSLIKEKVNEKEYSHQCNISNNLQEDISIFKDKSKKEDDNIYMFVKILK